MRIADQLKEVLKHNNVTTVQLALKMNTSQPNLAGKLSRDSLKLSDVKEISDALGYDELQVVLRGNGETVIIREDKPITIKKNVRYMIYDEDITLTEEFEKYGINETKFKDMVWRILEPELSKKFGDLWETTIPKRLEEHMVTMIENAASQIINIDDSDKDDNC